MITWLQLIILIVLLYVIFEKLRQWRLEGNLPGPPTVPFFGNGLIFLGCNAHDLGRIIMQLQNLTQYGNKLWRLWIGPHLAVFVADPKSLEIIFKSNELLNKSMFYDFFDDVLDGVFISSEILASSKTDIQLKEDLTYLDDVRVGSHLIFDRLFKIWLHPDFIYKHTRAGKLKQTLANRVLGFGLNLINERREFLNEIENSITVDSHSNTKTFLDHMLDYAKAKNLTDLELSMSITDVIIAGSDTTACAISYMLLMLALYQNVQEQVYEEIHEIFGDSDRPVELKDMNRMPVLERVIMEVLRHCCVPHIARKVDSLLYLQNNHIPVGITLYVMIYRLHKDPEYWSHPDSFYPDHFLPENVKRRPKYTYLPFVSGLRACPGQKLSSIIMKIAVSTILRQYKITTTVHPSEVKLSMTLMLEVSGGSDVQLTRRLKK